MQVAKQMMNRVVTIIFKLINQIKIIQILAVSNHISTN